MILSQAGLALQGQRLISCTFGTDIHHVYGFFYIPGFRSGEESIAQVQHALEETGAIPFEKMYGAYVYALERDGKEVFFFACNGANSCLFFSPYATSNSYIELLRYLSENKYALRFDLDGLTSYLIEGKTFFGHTLVQGVSLLPNDSYVHWENGQMSVCKKGIADLDGDSGIQSPYQFFADLAHAAENQKTSLSLTGGYDSRMVFSQTYQKLPLKLFLSANDPKYSDFAVAKKVADAVHVPIERIHTEKPQLSEALIQNMIYTLGGLRCPAGAARQCCYRSRLQKQGCTLELTGDGGVLHKDWEWMQDLPFYHKKHTDLHRFYHHRIAFAPKTARLGPAVLPIWQQQEASFVEQMKPYLRTINTESYDFLYYYVSGDARVGYAFNQTQYIAYAPLLELDLVRYAYRLPRRRRFYYNYLRELTTNGCPEIARIPTNYGTTASNELRYLLRDLFFQCKEYGVKAFRMLYRKFFHRTPFPDIAVDWSLNDELAKLPFAEAALQWSIENRLIAQNSTTSDLSYEQLMRICHLYVLSTDFGVCV